MRVYISGPITGVSDYKDKFKKAEKELKEQGFDVINPTVLDKKLQGLDYEEYMKIDLCLLELCDAIYMLKGWQKSRGANREYGYAMAKDYAIMEERNRI